MTTAIAHSAVPTAALPAVALDELISGADLQTRVDRKYLVPTAGMRDFVQALPAGTCVLEIDGRRTFGYESTYFDTPGMRCYFDAARRRRKRFKVRTRYYSNSGLCRLEVKTRDGRHRTVKTAFDYDGADRGRLTPAAGGLVATALGSPTGLPLAPSLVTTYRRTTFVLPGTPVRVTVDTDIEFQTPHGRSVSIGGWTIVETKTGPTPVTVDRLLWRQGHRPTKISKYGTGLALLNPDTPANKWHRTIRTLQRSTS